MVAPHVTSGRSVADVDDTIGEVARRVGVTERTLRYYEELGLLDPSRDTGGHRRYHPERIQRLYRVRLLRELGTPVSELDPDSVDLLALTARQLAGIDRQVTELSRLRERVRTVEERLMGGQAPTDEELVGVLTGIPDAESAMTRRLTLLVYADIAAAHRHLVEVFGFAAGELARDEHGTVTHGEVHVGDGLVWMHGESADFGLASPATLGGASHCMAVHVDDIDAHHARVRDAGAEIVYEPIVMDDGRIGDVELSVGGAVWMMAEEFPEVGVAPPDRSRGAAVSLHLTVDNVDAVVDRLVAAGTRMDRGPEDHEPPIGRVAVFHDPFGHRWYLNQGPAE